MKVEPIRLSYSAHDTHQRCPCRWYWRQERGLVPVKEAIPLLLGRDYHTAIANLRRAEMRQAGKGYADVHQPYGVQGSGEPSEIAKFLAKLYAQHYANDPLEYVAVEQPFFFWVQRPKKAGYDAEAVTDVTFCGQIDALAFHQDKLWVVESKTASQVDNEYLAKLPLDSQITAYSLGALSWLRRPENAGIRRRCKGKLAGVIYDVAAKPRRYRRDGEGCLEWLHRCEADYAANLGGWFVRQLAHREMAKKLNYVESLLNVAHLVEESRVTSFWDQHTTMCFMRNWECPYSRICIEGETDRALMGYRPEEPFSEINGPLPRPNSIPGVTR